MFNLFSKSDLNAAEMHAEAIAKIVDLKTDIDHLEGEVDKMERSVQSLLVDDAFGDKNAAAKADAETQVLMATQRKLEAKRLALEAIQEELPNLEAGKLAFEREQLEESIKADAAQKLKALPAAVKKAQKAAEAHVAAQIELAAVSRQAATAVEEDTVKALRAEYQAFRGYSNFQSLGNYHNLTQLEQASFNLKDTSERGSQGKQPENACKPTEAEKAEAKRQAVVAYTQMAHQTNSNFRGGA